MAEPETANTDALVTLADYRLAHDRFLDRAKAALNPAEYGRLVFDLEQSLKVRRQAAV